MAFRQSYTSVKKPSEPSTFMGKYGLKKQAGMDKEGSEAFVIPLDMQNGYACIPYHAVKKNGDKGFKDSIFGSVKIACHRYDKETGEASAELPLCCKLAQIEKDRKPDSNDSIYRMLSFTNRRNVIPVLVLSTTEDDPKKKPSLKKLSLNGIGFSFLDLAETSYEKELNGKIIEELETSGEIDDAQSMDPQELLGKVVSYLQHSVIKVTNVKADSPSIPYVKSFKVVPVESKIIGAESGEGTLIKTLCKQLAGDYAPEVFDKIYAKYPLLKEINNQISDYIDLFYDNIDSLVEEWTDEELQSYYNSFIDKQEQVDKYKDINDNNAEAAESDEDVEFVEEAAVPAKKIVPVAAEDDFDDFEVVQAPAKEKELVAAAVATSAPAKTATEDEFDYSSVSLDASESSIVADNILSDEDFNDDEFSLDEDSF